VQSATEKVRSVFKAAVVLLGTESSKDDADFVLLAKSRLPSRRTSPISLPDQREFFLTFPAGHFNPKRETAEQGALRELSEETGGYFFTDSIPTPWGQAVCPENLFAQCCKLEANSLQLINKEPVELVMSGFRSERLTRVFYSFFFLKVPGLTSAKLSLFCKQASEQFRGESFSFYREITEYIPVPTVIFLAQLKKFSDFEATPNWFFSYPAGPADFTLFQAGTLHKSYQCNKGYFYALSRDYATVRAMLLQKS
jgi:8-oxo-dGTP pyrophosphatase MutT (NUDIX family)